MIQNFSDHAANERTFLAWVRTAIALMAFGFVVERFNLFLLASRAALGAKAAPPSGAHLGALAGLGLMGFGLAIVAVATLRFVRTSQAIDDDIRRQGPGERLDIALAVMLVFLGCALVAYLVFNLASPR